MGKIYRITSVLAIFISVSTLVIVWTGQIGHRKSGYVLLSDLRDSFQLSKELDAKFKSLVNQRNFLLDSIRYNIQVAEKQGLNELTYYRQIYVQMAHEFEESNLKLKDEFDRQIWVQINQYLLEFGKEKGYTYIFGASGSGSLMYGAESENITKEAVIFVNNRFRGKK